jgi:hypothetical protein
MSLSSNLDISDQDVIYVTPSQLRELSKNELYEYHRIIHQLYDEIKGEGGYIEDEVNAHVFIVEEFKRRNLKHVIIPGLLDRESGQLAKSIDELIEWAPVYPSGENMGREVSLDEVVQVLKDFRVRTPIAYLVGGIVNNRKTKGDIDILLKGDLTSELRHIIHFRLGRMFPPELSQRIQFLDDDFDGPFTNHIPIADLMVKVRDDFIVKEMSIERISKANDIYQKYPSGSRKSVVQLHFRGKSLHTDYRVDVGDHLVGWTLASQIAGKIPDIETLEQAKGIIESYSPERGNKYLKPMYGTSHLFATMKAAQPKEWLKVQGMVEPGGVGATRYEEGLFLIVDKPTTEFGYQSKEFHEYFLTGSKIGWNGVLYFRQIDRATLKLPGEKHPSRLMWITSFKTNLLPYMLSSRAVRLKKMPPDGISGIPSTLMSQVPKEFRYWEEKGEKAREVRDALVKNRLFTEDNIKLVNGKFIRVETKYFLPPSDIDTSKSITSSSLDTGGKAPPSKDLNKIKYFATYDPEKKKDKQLRADFKIIMSWFSILKEDPRKVEFTRSQLLDLLVKIIKELVKRDSGNIVFTPSWMKRISREAFDAAIRRGKIKIPERMLKSDQENTIKSFTEVSIFKAEESNKEERIIGGVVLKPNETDLQGHIYDAETVRGAAHYFMEGYFPGGKHGPRIMHKGRNVSDKVRVLESFLMPFDFEVEVSFLGKVIKKLFIKQDSWVIYARILCDELWQDIKSKKFTGFSIGGTALVRVLSPNKQLLA